MSSEQKVEQELKELSTKVDQILKLLQQQQGGSGGSGGGSGSGSGSGSSSGSQYGSGR